MKKRSTRCAVRGTKYGENILIAGFGGQGIVFLGNVIARAAVLENKQVTHIRSYGAEMRGGTAHCMVRLSLRPIASPIFDKASVAIILNQPSFSKFKKRIEKGGILVLNAPSADDLNQKALKLGSLKVANIIGLGIALRKRLFLKLSSAERVLKDVFKDKDDLLKANLKALRLGYSNG
jgi:2-oxoglutarate ferredoxin oxidoreductase subunit gamma